MVDQRLAGLAPDARFWGDAVSLFVTYLIVTRSVRSASGQGPQERLSLGIAKLDGPFVPLPGKRGIGIEPPYDQVPKVVGVIEAAEASSGNSVAFLSGAEIEAPCGREIATMFRFQPPGVQHRGPGAGLGGGEVRQSIQCSFGARRGHLEWWQREWR